MDCACMELVGLSIAPEPTINARFHSPASNRFMIMPQDTDAMQPHPLPPAWVSWVC